MRKHPTFRGLAGRGGRVAVGGVLVAVLSGAGGALVAQGCGEDILDFCAASVPDAGFSWDLCCPDPANSRCPPVDGGDADASATGDAGSDSSDADDAATDGPIGPGCPGPCVPYSASGWDLPALVYIGPELQAPSCAALAGHQDYSGHADLSAPNVCGTCACGPPTSGSCDLPTTLTASAATCATTDPSTPRTVFDAPMAWDGGCTSNDAVPAGLPCDGGDCVQSLTLGPLAMNETGCVPDGPAGTPDAGTTHAPATWTTFARLCREQQPGSCGDLTMLCLPPFSAADGVHACLYHDGDVDCPPSTTGPFQEKHVFYDGYEDTRSCSPCACGPPGGGACSAAVSIYADDACASAATYVETIDSSQPACHDLIAGTALGSKSASAPVYTPGTCAPIGGEPMGGAAPVGPATLCCIPSP